MTTDSAPVRAAPRGRITDTTFGMELVLDLRDCDPQAIRSRDLLIKFARELCRIIDMEPFGEPWAERFGFGTDKSTGYSLVQLIETSCITGHFSEAWNAAYINVFSCRDFDPEAAARFAAEFFRAQHVKTTVLLR